MYSVNIKDEFYNSSIVQGLRMLFPKNFQFTKSTEIDADIVFPFCSNLSFKILYADHLNKEGIIKVQTLAKKYPNLVAVICISPKDTICYEKFICKISQDIKAIVYFPIENFQKSASSFIFDTVSHFKKGTRAIEIILKQKRSEDLNPDIQAQTIFSCLIKPIEVKNKI